MKKPLPARRHYRPVPALLTELPFIASPRHNRKHGRPYGSLWQVPPTEDYTLAYATGREYAAHFAQYLKNNPFIAGSNLLGRIAMEMNFADASSVRGYWVGFFSFLEHLICIQSAQHDVFAELDQFNTQS